jgi:hypothetical protein
VPHEHYVATECPGTLDLERIVTEANRINGDSEQPAPDPVDPELTQPEPDPEMPEEEPMSEQPQRHSFTSEQLAEIVAAARAASNVETPSAPIVSDKVAKPIWIVGTLIIALIGPTVALTVIDYAEWFTDPNVPLQFSATVGSGVGLTLGALGLSRYGKTKS